MRRFRPDADFAAAFAEGKDFAGIERGIGIEGVMDASHEIEIGVGEDQRHELGLFHADTVLAGERAADFDAVTDDFGGGLHGAFELRGVARIVQNDGVQIAVPGMKNVADLKAELRANLLDAAESLRKFRTRDDAIEDVIAGSEAAERAEGVLAAFPKEFTFGIVTSDADFAGVVRIANFGDGIGLRGDGLGEAFDLDQKNGGAVHGKASVDVVFDGAQSPAVEHFAGGGSDGACGDVHNGLCGVIDRIENSEKRFHGLGFAREFDGDFGDESEGAFRADKKAGEIEAGCFAVLAADAKDFTVWEDELEGGDVIGSDAVGESVRAAGIFRDVAADGAGLPTGRIGSEVEAVRFGGAGELVVDDAGLHDGALIFGVHFKNAVHTRKNNHHAAGAGKRTAGKTGTGAAADDGSIVFGGEFDDAGDVLRGRRKNDEVGAALFDRAVVFVQKKVFRFVEHGGLTKEFFEFLNKTRVHRACAR
jgi:hypothetical protein